MQQCNISRRWKESAPFRFKFVRVCVFYFPFVCTMCDGWLFHRCSNRDINDMAPHFLVSLYTVHSLLFVNAKPNDNNVRFESLLLFFIPFYVSQSSSKQFQFIFSVISLFISPPSYNFFSLLLFIVALFWHFSQVFHFGIAIVILSHIQNPLVRKNPMKMA